MPIAARDREILAFAAEHRLVLSDHVRALCRVSAAVAHARLLTLERAGFLTRQRVFPGGPVVHLIGRDGLAVIGSELKPPRFTLACYEHDVGVAWLWLGARAGTFGPIRRVIGERRLRSTDARREPGEAPLAVRLGGVGPRGSERLHYPDLLLVDHRGRRVALELELSAKGRGRREQILGGYGAEARVDAVVYLVTSKALGRSIAASAHRLGLSSRVYVRLVRWTVAGPARESGLARTRIPMVAR